MSRSGLSSARLGRMHEVLAGYVERSEVAGLVSLVGRHGEVHVDVIGTLALGDASRPVQRDSLFRISSMTKPIIGVATLLLVEECRLRLDDPVERWLPELADRQVLRRLDGPLDETVPAVRSITVRDLLTFRLGFGQMIASPEDYPILAAANEQQIGMGPPAPQQMPEPDEWLRRLSGLPLMYQPGERWMYNTGSDVLGVLLSRVAGQSLERFLQERLFAPLAMKDTSFWVPESALDRLATSYWDISGPGEFELYDEAVGGQWSRPPVFPSGAGGLVSTIDDYLAFAQMLLSFGAYGGARILSRPSVELMTTDQLTEEQKAVSGLFPGFFEDYGWGLGVCVFTKRDELWAVPGRYGWDGGLGTSWYSDPHEDMITILMTQRALTSPRPINVDFWTLACQAIDD
jgi:CubicO group peptidase (beta-lactamase class C family)